ncbi:MAG: hypothetical protein QNJ54_07055 [Prochloraceae cyanobacterium]|nr:hypothetical protein [Prochloraceae cyanobacterium]
MAQKSRSELQGLFKTGDKPSQQDFADFIESTLNIRDDGIEKPSGADTPLKITAQGTDEKLLDFYAGEAKTWSINQKPGEDKVGLNISNSGGSKLFIASSNGNVGLSIDRPTAKLHIQQTGNEDALRIDDELKDTTPFLINKDGNVGIGTPSPGAKLSINGGLHVGGDSDPGDNNLLVDGNIDIKGVMSGTANDYQKAQFTMSGGGKVTWGGVGGRLKWTKRFIAISMERGASFSNGYVNIEMPTSDIPGANVYNGEPRSANADGVILNGWEALYAVHALGGNESAVSYRIVVYQQAFSAPSNWLLVAVVNSDDNTIKLGTGVIISAKSSSDRGSSLPSGTILMWSGQVSNIPDGWALCNGQNSTPDLRDRFIVAAGNSYQPQQKGGQATVTLRINQIPSHNHTNGNFKYLLQSTGTSTYHGASDNTPGEPNLLKMGEMRTSGGDGAHENRPPYYALCFIMKL